MLNGRILAADIVTNVFDQNIQQIGIDLNLLEVFLIPNHWKDCGTIPQQGKTILPKYQRIPLEEIVGHANPVWSLAPGTYNITFQQGCRIPSDVFLLIRQRSSLLRCGTIIHSSVFDPGFETDNMGCVMVVTTPIQIEQGARVAQIYGHKCSEVLLEDLYGSEAKGSQFQKDNQRNANAG